MNRLLCRPGFKYLMTLPRPAVSSSLASAPNLKYLSLQPNSRLTQGVANLNQLMDQLVEALVLRDVLTDHLQRLFEHRVIK